jgi:uncharacterized membrane protein (UPF0127 family)
MAKGLQRLFLKKGSIRRLTLLTLSNFTDIIRWRECRSKGLMFRSTKKGGHGMHFKKIFVFIALSMVIGFDSTEG